MATEPETRGRARMGMQSSSAAQKMATLIAAVFVLVGILGFVPGITTNLYDGLKFAGDEGNSKLLGLFQVSWLHNFVHLGFGLVGFALAKTWSGARSYLIGGGAVYLVLWLLGLFDGGDWIPLNDADNWLHFGLGVGLITVGVLTTRGSMADRPAV